MRRHGLMASLDPAIMFVLMGVGLHLCLHVHATELLVGLSTGSILH